MPRRDRRLLTRAVAQAGGEPFFLASLLLAYARAEGLNGATLARRLGCAPADLEALLLCRRPAVEPSAFSADVRRIAERFGVEPIHLAQTIRVAEALEALGIRSAASDAQTLAAARDRDDREDGEP